MNKALSLLLCIVLALILCVPSVLAEEAPETFTSGDYVYVLLDDGTAMITKYTGDDEELSIPEELNGITVTAIDKRGFWHVYNLSSVTIPDSITTIHGNPFRFVGELAEISVSPDHPTLAVIDNVLFNKATKALICYPAGLSASEYSIPKGILTIGDSSFAFADLVSITIPDSVTFIDNSAFVGCFSLTSITIPDSVISIGGGAFAYCTSMREIYVSADHPTLAVIANVLFDKTEKTLLCYPAGLSASEYSIPQGICTIGVAAFCGSGVTSVTIPDSVSQLSESAFDSCSNLSTIILPDSITSIGPFAFIGCCKLTAATIPGSVTFIGEDAFYNCSDNLVLTVDRDSYARQYAIDNGINFTYPDVNDWLNS